jgi:hypothetical protein
MSQNDLKRAYDLIRQDRHEEARQILVPLCKTQADLIDAWWLLSWAVQEPDQIRAALQRVLMIDPWHEQATERLAKLEAPAQARRRTQVKPRKRNAAPILGLVLLFLMVMVAAGAAFLVINQQQAQSDDFQLAGLPTLNPIAEAQVALTQVAAARALHTQAPSATPIIRNTLPPTWTPSPTATLLPLPTITFAASPAPTQIPSATFAFPTLDTTLQPPTEVADANIPSGPDSDLLARTYWEGDGQGSMEDYQLEGAYLRHFSLPVTVWIDPSTDITWRHKTEEAVAILAGVVSMEMVSTEAEADIPIYVMETGTYVAWCPFYTAGCAEINIESDKSGQYIEVVSWVRIRADATPNANLLAHELIHALGVIVHSPNPVDVMYFEYNKQDQDLLLTEADRLILQILYSQPALGEEFGLPD